MCCRNGPKKKERNKQTKKPKTIKLHCLQGCRVESTIKRPVCQAEEKERTIIITDTLSASFFFFWGRHSQHAEVPRVGVELELQLPAYTTATATWIRAASVTYTTAHSKARSLIHWARPEIKSAPMRILDRFVSAAPQQELQKIVILKTIFIILKLCSLLEVKDRSKSKKVEDNTDPTKQGICGVKKECPTYGA